LTLWVSGSRGCPVCSRKLCGTGRRRQPGPPIS
jgi:hypothetical protein